MEALRLDQKRRERRAGEGPARRRLRRDEVPSLYALADVAVLGKEATPAAVQALAEAGIRWIQLRAKHLPDRQLYTLVERCAERLRDTPSRLWINDRSDLALLFPDSCLHLGQHDLPPGAARQLLGEQIWIGRSTHDLSQVCEADADPAVDVIALGPIYPTANKENPEPVVGLEDLRRARGLTEKPLVAIGGIDVARLMDVFNAGADSVALLGAICSGDVARNAERLLSAVAEIKSERKAAEEDR